MLTILQWIAAHFFADFVLQSKKLIQQKKERKAGSWFLYVHSLIHASLIYFFSPDKSLWIIPVIIFFTHYFIDLWKVYQKEAAAVFIIDQLMHIVVLVTLWVVFYENIDWPAVIATRILINNNFWVIITAYLFVIYPLAYLLGYATQRWRKDIEQNNDRSSTSLSEAGKWIGVCERILVLTFVINNHFEGIGFLIAAKSILRFNDIKADNMRKEAEYVLIGTLMSFASSIIIGIFARLLMQ
jgi:hypothetical protein